MPKKNKKKILKTVLFILACIPAAILIINYILDTEDRNFRNYVYSGMSKLYDNVEFEEIKIFPREEDPAHYELLIRFTAGYPVNTNDSYGDIVYDDSMKDIKAMADLWKICMDYIEKNKESKFSEVSSIMLSGAGDRRYNVAVFDAQYDEKFRVSEDDVLFKNNDNKLDKLTLNYALPPYVPMDALLIYFSDCKQIDVFLIDGSNPEEVYNSCRFDEFENLKCLSFQIESPDYSDDYWYDEEERQKLLDIIKGQLSPDCRLVWYDELIIK